MMAGAAMAGVPVRGFNSGWIVREVRYEANPPLQSPQSAAPHNILFTAYPANFPAENYVFRCYWSSTGNGAYGSGTTYGSVNAEDAKMLFSALSLARALNKSISFSIDGSSNTLLGTLKGDAYEFRSIGVSP